MGSIKNAFKSIFSPTASRTTGILIILVIAAAVPFTVFVAQKQQELRQHAAESIDAPDGFCGAPYSGNHSFEELSTCDQSSGENCTNLKNKGYKNLCEGRGWIFVSGSTTQGCYEQTIVGLPCVYNNNQGVCDNIGNCVILPPSPTSTPTPTPTSILTSSSQCKTSSDCKTPSDSQCQETTNATCDNGTCVYLPKPNSVTTCRLASGNTGSCQGGKCTSGAPTSCNNSVVDGYSLKCAGSCTSAQKDFSSSIYNNCGSDFCCGTLQPTPTSTQPATIRYNQQCVTDLINKNCGEQATDSCIQSYSQDPSCRVSSAPTSTPTPTPVSGGGGSSGGGGGSGSNATAPAPSGQSIVLHFAGVTLPGMNSSTINSMNIKLTFFRGDNSQRAAGPFTATVTRPIPTDPLAKTEIPFSSDFTFRASDLGLPANLQDYYVQIAADSYQVKMLGNDGTKARTNDQIASQGLTGLTPIKIYSSSTGTISTIPAVTLAPGDINNDGVINISDFFDVLVPCFGIKQTTLPYSTACLTATQNGKFQPDINRDGRVDGIDVNLFFKAINNSL